MKKATIITLISFLCTLSLQAMESASVMTGAKALALGCTLMAKGESKAALDWFFKALENGNYEERKEAQKCIRLLLDNKTSGGSKDDSQSDSAQWERDLKTLLTLVSKDVRISEREIVTLLTALAHEAKEAQTPFTYIECEKFISLLSNKLKKQLVTIILAAEQDFMLKYVAEILEDVVLIDQLISSDWDMLLSNPAFLLTHKVYSKAFSSEKENAFIAYLRMREAKKEILDEFMRKHNIMSEEETGKAHDAKIERMRQSEEARQKAEQAKKAVNLIDLAFDRVNKGEIEKALDCFLKASETGNDNERAKAQACIKLLFASKKDNDTEAPAKQKSREEKSREEEAARNKKHEAWFQKERQKILEENAKQNEAVAEASERFVEKLKLSYTAEQHQREVHLIYCNALAQGTASATNLQQLKGEDYQARTFSGEQHQREVHVIYCNALAQSTASAKNLQQLKGECYQASTYSGNRHTREVHLIYCNALAQGSASTKDLQQLKEACRK